MVSSEHLSGMYYLPICTGCTSSTPYDKIAQQVVQHTLSLSLPFPLNPPSITTTTMAKESTYMLSHRDEQVQESERLERQYDLLKHVFSGQLLHPSIPPFGDHFDAADIGTGTGVWLNDLARTFPRPAGSLVRLVGFDISSSKYPSANEDGVDLVVYDFTKRFPKEYHGVFDVVHLRLLVYAIREVDVVRVVENVTELLRQCCLFHWFQKLFHLINALCFPETFLC